jgi:hypothetical protein
MAIDFESLLTTQQKRDLLQNRIAQFAAEAYQYTLNKKTAEDINSESQIEAADKNLEILESAIRIHQAELEQLPSDVA